MTPSAVHTVPKTPSNSQGQPGLHRLALLRPRDRPTTSRSSSPRTPTSMPRPASWRDRAAIRLPELGPDPDPDRGQSCREARRQGRPVRVLRELLPFRRQGPDRSRETAQVVRDLNRLGGPGGPCGADRLPEESVQARRALDVRSAGRRDRAQSTARPPTSKRPSTSRPTSRSGLTTPTTW